MGALQFVFVLAGCALTWWGIWLTVTSIRRDHDRTGPAPDSHPLPDLDPYELAFLAGGPSRVTDTAIAVLVRADALRIARGGDLHAVADSAEPAADVERALLAAVRARPGGMDAGDARRLVADGPETDALRRRLAGLGLVHQPSGTDPVPAKLALLLALSVLAVAAAVAGVAAFLLAPDGLLVAGTLVTGVTGLAGFHFHARERRALRDAPTPAGRRELERVRRQYGRGKLRGSRRQLDRTSRVALYGLDKVGDQRFEELSKRHSYPVNHQTTSMHGAGWAGGWFGGGHSGSDRSGRGSSGGDGHSGSDGGDGGGGAGCGGGGCGGGGA